jgi:3-oxoacyl-(acyl-carrier-protein) synthase
LVGEGAAAVQLRPSTAVSGQTVSVLGIGTTCDAGHPTDPSPEGIWVEQAARAALAAAEIAPKDVAAVVSHGTGTGKNDAAEALAIRRLWPDGSIPVTSIKGALGHTMGAAGLFNILVANEAIRSGVLPPTVSDGSPVLCGIDLVRGEPREIPRGGAVIVLASGFGGNNVACVLAAE